MTQRLTGMGITRVSLVDKGANAKRLAVFKRDEEGPMSDPIDEPTRSAVAGFLQKAADLLIGKRSPVAKVQTFAAMVAGRELNDALDESWWTLQDALWSAMYARDDDGADLSLGAKEALVGQNLDEFKAYLLAAMSDASAVAKRDPSEAARTRAAVTTAVEKVGRKISGSRLERLQAAAEALTSVLDEVAEAVVDEAADTAEEVQVDKAELVAALTEANAPIVKRLEVLETKIEKAEPAAGTGTAGEDDAEGEDDAVTLETIATAVEKILDRVEALEGGAAVRKSLAGQDGTEPVKKASTFAGVM